MHTIKSVGVLSVAKIMGVLYFALGLILMPIILLAGLAGMMAGGREAAFSGITGLVMGHYDAGAIRRCGFRNGSDYGFSL